MSPPRLAIFGSLTTDNVLTAQGVALPRSYAGNVVYAALGARLWATEIGIVSRAGRDFSRAFLDRIAACGIDTGGVRWLDEPHQMNCAFCYRADGSRERAFPPAALAALPAAERGRFLDYTTFGVAHRYQVWQHFAPDAGDLPPMWLPSLAGVHAAAMPIERHLATALSLRRARPDLYIQVDSPWYDARDLSIAHGPRLFAAIDRLLPSEADLAVVWPAVDPVAAGRALLGDGLGQVVLKLGGAGCALLARGSGRVIRLPACPVEAVDPTGAGDAFCGGFLAGWLCTGDAIEAALRGTVSASFAVAAVGLDGLLTADPASAAARLASLRREVGQLMDTRGAQA